MLRKGLTPLITTFGLTAIAVTIGVILMNINYSGTTCTGEKIEFMDLNGVKLSCFDDLNAKIIIRNTGYVVLKKNIVNLNGENFNIPGNINHGELVQLIVPSSQDFNKVTVTPNTCIEEKIIIDLSRCST